MAGHSKFKNIMHRKGAQDARRAKRFARLIKELKLQLDLAHTESNPRLSGPLFQLAKQQICQRKYSESTSNKAKSGLQDNLEEIVYEGFGPGGAAIIVEALTDNRNRTASEVRSSFTKHNEL